MSKKKVDKHYAVRFKLDMKPTINEENLKEYFPKTYKKMIPYFKKYCEEKMAKGKHWRKERVYPVGHPLRVIK